MSAFARAVACAGLLAAAVPAAAQAPDPTPPGGGPLQVQRIHSALVAQPDVKITDLDGRTSTLIGGQVGVLTDDTFFAGGAFYMNANREDDLKMTYGGLVLGWQLVNGGAVSAGVKGLVGFGEATLGDTVSFAPRPVDLRRGAGGPPTTVRFLSEEGFFVAEPQGTVQWRILPWMAVDGSVGYRIIAGADRFDERLRGAVGSIGIRFGG